jgi:hypothetical protein
VVVSAGALFELFFEENTMENGSGGWWGPRVFVLKLAQFQKLLVINMPERTDRRDAVNLAAAVSNMKVEFVMGVRGESIPEDALPPGGSTENIRLPIGIKGSWRSHMNALQQ